MNTWYVIWTVIIWTVQICKYILPRTNTTADYLTRSEKRKTANVIIVSNCVTTFLFCLGKNVILENEIRTNYQILTCKYCVIMRACISTLNMAKIYKNWLLARKRNIMQTFISTGKMENVVRETSLAWWHPYFVGL